MLINIGICFKIIITMLENHIAKRLYESFTFKDTGKIIDGDL